MSKPSEIKPWMSFWGTDFPDEKECACSVYEFLYQRNKDYLDQPALRYVDRRITFGELFENIQATAKAFYQAGIRAGDIVTICSVMTPETIYAFYALDILGAAVNLADPRTSPRGLHGYIHEVKSTVVVSLSVAYDKIAEAVKDTAVQKVVVNSPADSLPAFKKFAYKCFKKDKPALVANAVTWGDFIAGGKDAQPVQPVPYDPAHAILIVHTGGTTGNPKSVMLGDRGLNALAVQMGLKRFPERGHRFLNIMPPFIAYGYGCGTHTPLCHGAEVILIPQFDPKEFGKLIKKYHPNHTAGVPLHYQGLIGDKTAEGLDLSFLKTTGAGGDAISLQAEEDVNAFLKEHHAPYKLSKGYGMTEVSAGISANVNEMNRRGSVGLPLCYTTVGIFKPDTDEELGFNEEGEICVYSPCRMLGYYEMPEETAKVMWQHSDGKMWVHTGDIGKIDEDGFLFVVNRVKRMIIRHDGFKVFPFAIENVISAVDGVQSACAVAVRDRDHQQGNLPFVFVVAKDPEADTAELEARIRAVCQDELAEYIQPVGYCFLKDLPYTGIGKVDYLSLQKQAEDIKY